MISFLINSLYLVYAPSSRKKNHNFWCSRPAVIPRYILFQGHPPCPRKAICASSPTPPARSSSHALFRKASSRSAIFRHVLSFVSNRSFPGFSCNALTALKDTFESLRGLWTHNNNPTSSTSPSIFLSALTLISYLILTLLIPILLLYSVFFLYYLNPLLPVQSFSFSAHVRLPLGLHRPFISSVPTNVLSFVF